MGMLQTIAGGGPELGDGGPATAAAFCGPTDVAVDSSGNVFVADAGIFCGGPGPHTVRKIDTTGRITTVAGTGVPGYSGDGGPANSAQLSAPVHVAVDGDGNLYIADVHNYRIRKVDREGVITTIAGTGEKGSGGDGGPAINAELFGESPPDFPGGLAVDAKGNLYVADVTTVRKIDTSGIITTVAGTGRRGYSGDGGPAIEAKVSALDVAVAQDGSLYISEWFNERVRRVDPAGTITTVAGTGMKAPLKDGVPATESPLWDPWGIAVDANGNLFIIEHHASVVQKVDPKGIITTVAGIFKASSGGGGLFNGDRGQATKIRLNEPVDLCVNDNGILYIADTFNERVRAIRYADGG